jgi:tRNA(fMet)-specific endonuclease VapC
LKYLIDSDWIIDLLLGRQDAISLAETLSAEGFGISLMTFVEVYEGIFGSRNPLSSERTFQLLLDGTPVVEISRLVALQTAEMRNALRSTGGLLPLPDVMIAATAIVHDLTLVTRNLKHFERIPNLKIYDHLAPQI